MQVIPVIDLQHGVAVHAIAGDRDNYQPVLLGGIRDGDPHRLASFYAARNPLAIYLADLDAILGGEVQATLWHPIARVAACPLWVDFGVRGGLDLSPFLELQHRSESRNLLVLGSETLQDISQIRKIANQISPEQFILSLDRKAGKPVSGAHPNDEIALLQEARAAGIPRVIALDLAGVGKGRALELLESWRPLMNRFPEFQWILGGGVSGPTDLVAASQHGFQAVLSATAILEGKL